jgi:hypothetical protein
LRYFLDTEFIDDGRVLDLVSIAVVDDDGREYYAVSRDFDDTKASHWCRAHVLSRLEPRTDPVWRDRGTIADDLRAFVADDHPVFWVWNGAHDWVVLTQLFGRPEDRPAGWPPYARELRQWSDALGNPRHPTLDTALAHHALEDARWTRDVHAALLEAHRNRATVADRRLRDRIIAQIREGGDRG